MSDRADIEASIGHKQLSKALDLLEDAANKLVRAIQSPDVIKWRVPELQLELARVYEALSRDAEAEAAYSAAAESARNISNGPTSKAFVQFAFGEFYLRRRMYARALEVTNLLEATGDTPHEPLVLFVRAHAYAALGKRTESVKAAEAFVSAAENKEGARRRVQEILDSAKRD